MLWYLHWFHSWWFNEIYHRGVAVSSSRTLSFCMLFPLSHLVFSIEFLSGSIIFSCSARTLLLLAFLGRFDCLILCFESTDEHVLNLLAMVKYGLKAMRQLKVGVENLAEDLWRSILHWLFLCLWFIRQEGIELIHELLDLDYDMMTCFSLLTSKRLHLFQFLKTYTEINCFEFNDYLFYNLLNDLGLWRFGLRGSSRRICSN